MKQKKTYKHYNIIYINSRKKLFTLHSQCPQYIIYNIIKSKHVSHFYSTVHFS